MIQREYAPITNIEYIAKDTVEMTLQNEYISNKAMPGQFVHVLVPGHTLRRPISIASVHKKENKFVLLFKVIGSGTEKLSTYTIGEMLDILGPAGNGFPLDKISKNGSLLLVGGGIGVPPIYFLATELHRQNIEAEVILGFQSKEFMFYEEKFKRLGGVTIVTDDGSYGKSGYVTTNIHSPKEYSQYFACGPNPMLQAMVQTMDGVEGFLSLEQRMGCGIGACYACVVRSMDGKKYAKICEDGPVFAANEVKL